MEIFESFLTLLTTKSQCHNGFADAVIEPVSGLEAGVLKERATIEEAIQ